MNDELAEGQWQRLSPLLPPRKPPRGRLVTGQVDAIYVTAAWVFVAFRALHSGVHCTFNLVMLRFYLYLIATLAVWFMVVRAALAHFGG